MAPMPPIGPTMPRVGSLVSVLCYLLIACYLVLVLHHCILITSASLSISMLSCSGLGSGRREHFPSSIVFPVYAIPAAGLVDSLSCNGPPAFSFLHMYNSSSFYSLHVLYCLYLVTLRVLSPTPLFSSISHTPDTPTRTSDTPKHPRLPTPRIAYTRTIAFRNLARISLHRTSLSVVALCLLSSRHSSPLPYAFFPALIWCNTSPSYHYWDRVLAFGMCRE